jgi:hypothetical protein
MAQYYGKVISSQINGKLSYFAYFAKDYFYMNWLRSWYSVLYVLGPSSVGEPDPIGSGHLLDPYPAFSLPCPDPDPTLIIFT